MKGSVYPALRHSHKGKMQSLLGRDPSFPNPDPILFAVLPIHSSTVLSTSSSSSNSSILSLQLSSVTSIYICTLSSFFSLSHSLYLPLSHGSLVRLSRLSPSPNPLHPRQKRRPLTRRRKPRNLVAIVSQRARSRPMRLSFVEHLPKAD